jgi:hypothetical protein
MVAGEIASPLLKLNVAPAAVTVAPMPVTVAAELNVIVPPESPFVSAVAA